MSVSLADVPFVNLYLGADFSDITGLTGEPQRRAVPAQLADGVQALRKRCLEKFADEDDDEFSLAEGGVVYRVTTVLNLAGGPVFMVRKSAAKIRALAQLGLPQQVVAALMAPGHGLVLIVGNSGSGKTTTASSVVAEWLKKHGGVAIVLEDPPETILEGLHGAGRCLQFPVSHRRQANGEPNGYNAALMKARRGAPSLIMVGETRDEVTASALIDSSIDGHRIISTFHASSVANAVERLVGMCPMKRAALADVLCLVIHQNLEPVNTAPSAPGGPPRRSFRMRLESLEVEGPVRAKIRSGNIASLGQDVAEQATRHAWKKQVQGLLPTDEKK